MTPRSDDERIWRWGLELDPARQLRRARRALSGGDDGALRARVKGRRVLVSGASAGIGRATAVRVGAAGAEVLLVARGRARLKETAAEIAEAGGIAHVLPCDLSDLDAVDALAARVVADHGGVDVLVNNAAHSIRRSLRHSYERLHDYERVMRLNYFGVIHLTLPLVREMRAQGGGHVVNVSTLGTQFGPEPRFSAYLASKGALEAFARSVAPETHDDGVTWTTVHMPLVRTEMIAPTRVFRRMPALSVSTAADMVVDGIVRRPVRVSHPYGVAFHLVDLALPEQLQRLMAAGMVERTPAGVVRRALRRDGS